MLHNYSQYKHLHFGITCHYDAHDRCSAGVRDSALTNHGALQAERLGLHFAGKGIRFTHIFSSDLQRAFKTADAIRIAQPTESPDDSSPLSVVQLPILREQDFGSFEGLHVSARSNRAKETNTPTVDGGPLEKKTNDGVFQDVESKEAMTARADNFLESYLIPTLARDVGPQEYAVAVVSHGIFLTVLWRCFLRRFTPSCVSAAPGALPARDHLSLEFLGGWSNTGYLELCISKRAEEVLPPTPDIVPIQATETSPDDRGEFVPFLQHWRLQIEAVNERDHLVTLKRTGGGVGSSKVDEEQRKIDTFFKRRRVD